MDEPGRHRLGAVAAAVGAAALWGGMYVVSKDTFADIPPITLGALRLLVAGATLAAVLGRRGRLRWPRERGLLVAAVALAGTLVTQFVGTELATASAGALLTTTTPLFLVPLGWIALRERPSIATVLGIAVGMAGVAIAVGGGLGGGTTPWGPGLLLVSAFGWAAYTVAAAPAARREGPLIAVTWSTLLAVPPLAALSLLEAERWRAAAFTEPATLAAIAYLGVAASAAAWYLWNRGVAGLPAAAAGAAFFVQPLVGGILAWVLLGERPTLGFIAGGVLILLGVVAAIGEAERRSRRPADRGPSRVPAGGGTEDRDGGAPARLGRERT